jgi:uncharacterized protein YqgC (DUF456 family)
MARRVEEADGVDPALLWILATLLVALGVAGVVVPGLPGVPLVLAGLVVGAWIDDFAYVGRGSLMVIALLALVATAVEFAASALGAKRAGAHRRAVIGAALGALVGLFFALPGLLIGPFAGAVIGEFSARGNLARAGRVGLATWIGMLLGGAAKLALVISMIAVFAFARFA